MLLRTGGMIRSRNAEFIGAATKVGTSGNTGETIAIPAAAAAGDWAFVFCPQASGANRACSSPGGAWTKYSGSGGGAVFYRQLTAGDLGQVASVNFDSATGSSLGIVVYRGGTAVTQRGEGTASATTITLTGWTPSTESRAVLTFGGHYQSAAAPTTPTAPTGFTSRGTFTNELNGGNFDGANMMADNLSNYSGSNIIWGTTAGAQTWVAWAVEIVGLG